MSGEIVNPVYGAGNNKVLRFLKGTYFKPVSLPAIGSHFALACHLRYRIMAGVAMGGTPRLYWGICNRANFNTDNPFSNGAHGFHMGQFYNVSAVATTTIVSSHYHGPNSTIQIGHYGRTAGGVNLALISGPAPALSALSTPACCSKDGILQSNACMDAGFGIHDTFTSSSWWCYWHNQFDSLADNVMDLQGAVAAHNQMPAQYGQSSGAMSAGWAGCSPAQPANSLASNRALQELDSMFVSWSSPVYPIEILACGISVIV